MKKDSNGYVPSILPTEQGKCFICGLHTDTARHEVYGGSNRKLSKENGLWVYLCPNCHQYGRHAVHNDRSADLALKAYAQDKYEETHSRADFMKKFMMNYKGAYECYQGEEHGRSESTAF